MLGLTRLRGGVSNLVSVAAHPVLSFVNLNKEYSKPEVALAARLKPRAWIKPGIEGTPGEVSLSNLSAYHEGEISLAAARLLLKKEYPLPPKGTVFYTIVGHYVGDDRSVEYSAEITGFKIGQAARETLFAFQPSLSFEFFQR